MGKKIPTKKHNKLKAVDPFNRTANSNILKSKDELRNFAPKKLSQDAPGSLRKLFSCDDTDESSKRKRKKKTDRITVRTLNYRDDTASLVSQDTYETDDQFLKRVSQMANRARERADISVKFDVRFNEDGTFEHEVTDASTLPTRKKRRLLEFKEKQKAKMRLKELHGANAVEQGQAREFPGRDRFRFGEVVHAPPEITAKLRGAPDKDLKKIAKSLLCNPENQKKIHNSNNSEKSMANDSGTEVAAMHNDGGKKRVCSGRPNTAINPGLEKIRWKKLEASKRVELEAERKRAIEAYRKLKNKT